jgi:predicted NUDIX family NTP pyrophosphohydrolase
MKRSAGILPYKYENNKLYVYLEHPGGPFYENIDTWSICKGEYVKEKAIDAAIREFKEESGFSIDKKNLSFLSSRKVNSQKIVTVFITKTDIDPSKMTSNTFTKEYPKGSGKICEFPEMDEGKWFSIDEAYKKIFKSQIPFLYKLEGLLE